MSTQTKQMVIGKEKAKRIATRSVVAKRTGAKTGLGGGSKVHKNVSHPTKNKKSDSSEIETYSKTLEDTENRSRKGRVAVTVGRTGKLPKNASASTDNDTKVLQERKTSGDKLISSQDKEVSRFKATSESTDTSQSYSSKSPVLALQSSDVKSPTDNKKHSASVCHEDTKCIKTSPVQNNVKDLKSVMDVRSKDKLKGNGVKSVKETDTTPAEHKVSKTRRADNAVVLNIDSSARTTETKDPVSDTVSKNGPCKIKPHYQSSTVSASKRSRNPAVDSEHMQKRIPRSVTQNLPIPKSNQTSRSTSATAYLSKKTKSESDDKQQNGQSLNKSPDGRNFVKENLPAENVSLQTNVTRVPSPCKTKSDCSENSSATLFSTNKTSDLPDLLPAAKSKCSNTVCDKETMPMKSSEILEIKTKTDTNETKNKVSLNSESANVEQKLKTNCDQEGPKSKSPVKSKTIASAAKAAKGKGLSRSITPATSPSDINTNNVLSVHKPHTLSKKDVTVLDNQKKTIAESRSSCETVNKTVHLKASDTGTSRTLVSTAGSITKSVVHLSASKTNTQPPKMSAVTTNNREKSRDTKSRSRSTTPGETSRSTVNAANKTTNLKTTFTSNNREKSCNTISRSRSTTPGETSRSTNDATNETANLKLTFKGISRTTDSTKSESVVTKQNKSQSPTGVGTSSDKSMHDKQPIKSSSVFPKEPSQIAEKKDSKQNQTRSRSATPCASSDDNVKHTKTERQRQLKYENKKSDKTSRIAIVNKRTTKTTPSVVPTSMKANKPSITDISNGQKEDTPSNRKTNSIAKVEKKNDTQTIKVTSRSTSPSEALTSSTEVKNATLSSKSACKPQQPILGKKSSENNVNTRAVRSQSTTKSHAPSSLKKSAQDNLDNGKSTKCYYNSEGNKHKSVTTISQSSSQSTTTNGTSASSDDIKMQVKAPHTSVLTTNQRLTVSVNLSSSDENRTEQSRHDMSTKQTSETIGVPIMNVDTTIKSQCLSTDSNDSVAQTDMHPDQREEVNVPCVLARNFEDEQLDKNSDECAQTHITSATQSAPVSSFNNENTKDQQMNSNISKSVASEQDMTTTQKCVISGISWSFADKDRTDKQNLKQSKFTTKTKATASTLIKTKKEPSRIQVSASRSRSTTPGSTSSTSESSESIKNFPTKIPKSEVTRTGKQSSSLQITQKKSTKESKYEREKEAQTKLDTASRITTACENESSNKQSSTSLCKPSDEKNKETSGKRKQITSPSSQCDKVITKSMKPSIIPVSKPKGTILLEFVGNKQKENGKFSTQRRNSSQVTTFKSNKTLSVGSKSEKSVAKSLKKSKRSNSSNLVKRKAEQTQSSDSNQRNDLKLKQNFSESKSLISSTTESAGVTPKNHIADSVLVQKKVTESKATVSRLKESSNLALTAPGNKPICDNKQTRNSAQNKDCDERRNALTSAEIGYKRDLNSEVGNNCLSLQPLNDRSKNEEAVAQVASGFAAQENCPYFSSAESSSRVSSVVQRVNKSAGQQSSIKNADASVKERKDNVFNNVCSVCGHSLGDIMAHVSDNILDKHPASSICSCGSFEHNASAISEDGFYSKPKDNDKTPGLNKMHEITGTEALQNSQARVCQTDKQTGTMFLSGETYDVNNSQRLSINIGSALNHTKFSDFSTDKHKCTDAAPSTGAIEPQSTNKRQDKTTSSVSSCDLRNTHSGLRLEEGNVFESCENIFDTGTMDRSDVCKHSGNTCECCSNQGQSVEDTSCMSLLNTGITLDLNVMKDNEELAQVPGFGIDRDAGNVQGDNKVLPTGPTPANESSFGDGGVMEPRESLTSDVYFVRYESSKNEHSSSVEDVKTKNDLSENLHKSDKTRNLSSPNLKQRRKSLPETHRNDTETKKKLCARMQENRRITNDDLQLVKECSPVQHTKNKGVKPINTMYDKLLHGSEQSTEPVANDICQKRMFYPLNLQNINSTVSVHGGNIENSSKDSKVRGQGKEITICSKQMQLGRNDTGGKVKSSLLCDSVKSPSVEENQGKQISFSQRGIFHEDLFSQQAVTKQEENMKQLSSSFQNNAMNHVGHTQIKTEQCDTSMNNNEQENKNLLSEHFLEKTFQNVPSLKTCICNAYSCLTGEISKSCNFSHVSERKNDKHQLSAQTLPINFSEFSPKIKLDDRPCLLHNHKHSYDKYLTCKESLDCMSSVADSKISAISSSETVHSQSGLFAENSFEQRSLKNSENKLSADCKLCDGNKNEISRLIICRKSSQSHGLNSLSSVTHEQPDNCTTETMSRDIARVPTASTEITSEPSADLTDSKTLKAYNPSLYQDVLRDKTSDLSSVKITTQKTSCNLHFSEKSNEHQDFVLRYEQKNSSGHKKSYSSSDELDTHIICSQEENNFRNLAVFRDQDINSKIKLDGASFETVTYCDIKSSPENNFLAGGSSCEHAEQSHCDSKEVVNEDLQAIIGECPPENIKGRKLCCSHQTKLSEFGINQKTCLNEHIYCDSCDRDSANKTKHGKDKDTRYSNSQENRALNSDTIQTDVYKTDKNVELSNHSGAVKSTSSHTLPNELTITGISSNKTQTSTNLTSNSNDQLDTCGNLCKVSFKDSISLGEESTAVLPEKEDCETGSVSNSRSLKLDYSFFSDKKYPHTSTEKRVGQSVREYNETFVDANEGLASPVSDTFSPVNIDSSSTNLDICRGRSTSTESFVDAVESLDDDYLVSTSFKRIVHNELEGSTSEVSTSLADSSTGESGSLDDFCEWEEFSDSLGDIFDDMETQESKRATTNYLKSTVAAPYLAASRKSYQKVHPPVAKNEKQTQQSVENEDTYNDLQRTESSVSKLETGNEGQVENGPNKDTDCTSRITHAPEPSDPGYVRKTANSKEEGSFQSLAKIAKTGRGDSKLQINLPTNVKSMSSKFEENSSAVGTKIETAMLKRTERRRRRQQQTDVQQSTKSKATSLVTSTSSSNDNCKGERNDLAPENTFSVNSKYLKHSVGISDNRTGYNKPSAGAQAISECTTNLKLNESNLQSHINKETSVKLNYVQDVKKDNANMKRNDETSVHVVNSETSDKCRDIVGVCDRGELGNVDNSISVTFEIMQDKTLNSGSDLADTDSQQNKNKQNGNINRNVQKFQTPTRSVDLEDIEFIDADENAAFVASIESSTEILTVPLIQERTDGSASVCYSVTLENNFSRDKESPVKILSKEYDKVSQESEMASSIDSSLAESPLVTSNVKHNHTKLEQCSVPEREIKGNNTDVNTYVSSFQLIQSTDLESKRLQRKDEISCVDKCENVYATTMVSKENLVRGEPEHLNEDICEESNISVKDALELEKTKMAKTERRQSRKCQFVSRRTDRRATVAADSKGTLQTPSNDLTNTEEKRTSVGVRKSQSFRIEKPEPVSKKISDEQEAIDNDDDTSQINKKVSDICKTFMAKTSASVQRTRTVSDSKSPVPHRKLMKWVNQNGTWKRIPVDEEIDLNEHHLIVSPDDPEHCPKSEVAKLQSARLTEVRQRTKEPPPVSQKPKRSPPVESNISTAFAEKQNAEQSLSQNLTSASASAMTCQGYKEVSDAKSVDVVHTQFKPTKTLIENGRENLNGKKNLASQQAMCEQNAEESETSVKEAGIDLDKTLTPENCAERLDFVSTTDGEDLEELQKQPVFNEESLGHSENNVADKNDEIKIIGTALDELHCGEEQHIKRQELLFGLLDNYYRRKPRKLSPSNSSERSVRETNSCINETEDSSVGTGLTTNEYEDEECVQRIPKIKAIKIQEEIFESPSQKAEISSFIDTGSSLYTAENILSNYETLADTRISSDMHETTVVMRKSKTFSGLSTSEIDNNLEGMNSQNSDDENVESKQTIRDRRARAGLRFLMESRCSIPSSGESSDSSMDSKQKQPTYSDEKSSSQSNVQTKGRVRSPEKGLKQRSRNKLLSEIAEVEEGKDNSRSHDTRKQRQSEQPDKGSNKRRSLSLPTGTLTFGDARIVYKNGHFTIETMDSTDVPFPDDDQVDSNWNLPENYRGDYSSATDIPREVTSMHNKPSMRRQCGKTALKSYDSAEDVFFNDSESSVIESQVLIMGQTKDEVFNESGSSRTSDMSVDSYVSDRTDVSTESVTDSQKLSSSSLTESFNDDVKRVIQRAKRTSSFRAAQSGGAFRLSGIEEDKIHESTRARSVSLDESHNADLEKSPKLQSVQNQNQTFLKKVKAKRKTLNENLNISSFAKQSESAREFFIKKMTLKGLFKKNKSDPALGSPPKSESVGPPIAAFDGDDIVDTPPSSPYRPREMRRRHTAADILRSYPESGTDDSNCPTPTLERSQPLRQSVSTPSTPSHESNSLANVSSCSSPYFRDEDVMSITSGSSMASSIHSPPLEQPHKPTTPKPVGMSPRRYPSVGSQLSRSSSQSSQRNVNASVTSLEHFDLLQDDTRSYQECECTCKGSKQKLTSSAIKGSTDSLTVCQYCKQMEYLKSESATSISHKSLSTDRDMLPENVPRGRKDSTSKRHDRLGIISQTDVASSNSNDSGIQRDASVHSSSESVKGAAEDSVRLRRNKSLSPNPDRPKSDISVRWADDDTGEGEIIHSPVKLRHRDQSSRNKPRPKSDLDGSSFLSERMKAFGSDVDLQPYCSLRNLYEMKRRDLDRQKNRRMSTPHPIKSRLQRAPHKLQKQPPLVRSSSMPECLDKIHKRRKLHHLLDFHLDTLSRHTEMDESLSDESQLSFDQTSFRERSISTLSSSSQLTAMDEDEDNLTYAEALWDHITMDPEELGFRAQDVIEVLDMDDKDWWFGVIDDREGWFPATFVRLRVNQDQLDEEDDDFDLDVTLQSSLTTSPKLRRISMMNKNQARSNVVNEIISAEREYVKHLRDVVEGYIQHARKRTEMFPEERIVLIFGNIETIYSFSQKFLSQLEMCIDTLPHLSEVGQCFLDNEKGFEIYSDYCNNHPSACEELDNLCRDSKYKHFFEACRLLQDLVEIPLEGFLLTPVQKICKYPLQLAELLKYTPPDHADYPKVKDALSAMRKIAMLINERKRKMESVEKIAVWQQSVVDWEGPDLLERSSELIFSGELNKINSAGWSQERFFFLFDHQVVYCKKELLKRHVFSYKGRIDLDHCDIVDVPDGKDAQYNATVKHGWKFHETRKDKWYLVYAKSEAVKQSWLKALGSERQRVLEDQENDFSVSDHWKKTVLSKVRSHSNLKEKYPTGRSSQGQLVSLKDYKDFTYATFPRRVSQKHDKKKGWFKFGGGKKSKR